MCCSYQLLTGYQQQSVLLNASTAMTAHRPLSSAMKGRSQAFQRVGAPGGDQGFLVRQETIDGAFGPERGAVGTKCVEEG